MSVGISVSPTKAESTEYENSVQLRNCKAKFLIIQEERWEESVHLFCNNRAGLPELKGLIVIERTASTEDLRLRDDITKGTERLEALGYRVMYYSDLIQDIPFPLERSARVAPDDVSFLPYTSGTTGVL
jgi:acyl-coenzyme A synthetase/AMP-(fatty) acid ligase